MTDQFGTTDAQLLQLRGMFQSITGRAMTTAEQQQLSPLVQQSSWDDIKTTIQARYTGTGAATPNASKWLTWALIAAAIWYFFLRKGAPVPAK